MLWGLLEELLTSCVLPLDEPDGYWIPSAGEKIEVNLLQGAVVPLAA